MRSFASSSANQLTDSDFDVLQEWILISIVQFEKISLHLERLFQIQISDSKITIKKNISKIQFYLFKEIERDFRFECYLSLI
jgi:hypothetical protein